MEYLPNIVVTPTAVPYKQKNMSAICALNPFMHICVAWQITFYPYYQRPNKMCIYVQVLYSAK